MLVLQVYSSQPRRDEEKGHAEIRIGDIRDDEGLCVSLDLDL